MNKQSGFTLIELSIVLVIIGLIIGGILTGQDLINAAAIRAQIAQIEHYNTAVRTFQNKYGYLPGDIPNPYATNFGFSDPPSMAVHGDGNGIIAYYGNSQQGDYLGCGETMLFWADLGTAGLLDGSYNALYSHNNPCTSGGLSATTNPALSAFLPVAKIGQNNYVYAWSGGYSVETSSDDGINYFGVSPITSINNVGLPNAGNQGPTMTVNQAYNIDKKVDDGLPQSGNVMAMYLNDWVEICPNGTNFAWAAGGYNNGAANLSGATCPPSTTTTAYQPYNCYDTSSTGALPETYSLKNGGVQNCALSFKFQ